MGKRKEWKFEISIARPNQQPDLEVNPTNIYTQMSEEERLEACVEGLADNLGYQGPGINIQVLKQPGGNGQ